MKWLARIVPAWMLFGSFVMMNSNLVPIVGLFSLLWATPGLAYDSGSTGADGAFAPTADVEVALPPDGIFNYTSVDIPVGVTVTFQKNAANTPVFWLVQGDVNVLGTINLNGQSDGIPGPGGYGGGAMGVVGAPGGAGLGPGGGSVNDSGTARCYGGGGSYGSQGSVTGTQFCFQPATLEYGRDEIVPFVGGSGGAGGNADPNGPPGSAGGGGGGAILIAASGTLNVTGTITADGAASVDTTGDGGCGGHGSGGAIKLVATTVTGNGNLSATSQPFQCGSSFGNQSIGGDGRIRLEAEGLAWSAATTPAFTIGQPRVIFVPNFPSITITSIAGVSVPANPTGVDDVLIPAATTNPVTIDFATTNVPLGSIVDLTIAPFQGVPTSVSSGGITGTEASGTDSVQVNLPDGSSSLNASVTFTVNSSAGRRFAPYADGQLVAKIRSSYTPGVGAVTTLITEDGQEFDWPADALGIN